MGGKGRRRLGPDERQLWERVAATASPLRQRPASLRIPLPPEPAPDRPTEPPVQPPAHPVPAPKFLARPDPRSGRAPKAASAAVAGWSFEQAGPPEAAPVGRPQAGLDRRTADRLRKGARIPDARIDLHGMTAGRAHGVCLRFLGEAVAQGHRVVLVITGKGRGDRGGVLRESLPGWLRASPLGQSVVGIYQAHRKHGGDGAFYVYLKRRR
jgi:DNA-nicking Smr family endonuclease